MEQELKVLIVDDDEVDRIAVRRALKDVERQICFTEAKSYAEAIASLEKQTFDCIFIDYGLPDRDGLAIVKTIHKLNIASPIVVLTGQGDEQLAVKLMKSGVTDYLPKSQVSSKTLPKVLFNAVRVYQAIMQATLADQRLHESHTLLIQKNHDLRLLEQQRQDFIAHLTHDLKTPIIAADLMLKLFHKEAFCPLSLEMHTAITAMIHSNKNLLDIVNTLLEVYCYESGAKELTLIVCDVWKIAQEVVVELRPLAQEKGIILRTKKRDEKLQIVDQFKVMGDYLELRRMLTNLIGNSIKFTEVGFVEIDLSLSPCDDTKNSCVSILVKDSGIGMSISEQESLFQRFRKGNHKQSGSGLGLHLVHRIVTAHQGVISVSSEIDRGSVFTIHLPTLAAKSTL